MSVIWKKWCRLCAGEQDINVELYNGIVGTNHTQRISKYLSIQLSESENDLPKQICQDCANVLSKFDDYAIRCERVQLMYQSLLGTIEGLRDDNSCQTIKSSFLDSVDNDENKFFPICYLKTEDDKKSLDNKINSDNIKKRKTDKLKIQIKFPEGVVKNEVLSDGGDVDDAGGMTDHTSDDDYLPLSSVTDSKTSLKRKRKSSKKPSKPKRKKSNKIKTKIALLDDLIEGEEVNIKEEPLSDEENIDHSIDAASLDGLPKLKKEKKDRKRTNVTCLKYECYICNEDCKNWHALCVHFRDLHNTRAKVMCCCGKFLASRVSIGRHCAKHGKSDSHDCPQCTKRFPRESELASHMITHLPKEEYPFVCCKCARRFTTQQLLRHHEKKHIPMEERMIHQCDICKSKFASKSSLLMHMKAVHERLKPFVCDQCGRAFTTKGILEEHQVRHSDARPHVCPVCQKSFKTKQRLAIHSDTHNDTVYQCPHCPIQLNSRRTLRMHLFVHDEVCRYQCNFCEKAFKRAKDLKNHSNLHTGRRPYSCPWCSRTFANGSNCRAHKRRMHPNELRISDASAALLNKVPASGDMETDDKKIIEAVTPKVIYTTVKRKVPVNPVSKIPNFTYRLDVTEKDDSVTTNNQRIDNYASVLPSKISNQSTTVHDMSISTKQEKSSPVHNYESSMSPLNLNTTSSSAAKYVNIRSGTNSSLTITPINPSEDSGNDYHEVNNSYQQEQNSIIQNRNINQSYSSTDYKEPPDQSFSVKSSQQIYSNFSNNVYSTAAAASSLAAATFNSSHPYGLHYARDEQNN